MANDLWRKIKKMVPKEHHQKVAEAIVAEFEQGDADDWSYEKGSVYQTARPEEVKRWEDEG